ncbi:MAG: hypothetical protein AAB433_02235 [Nitrospirota bacterium]
MNDSKTNGPQPLFLTFEQWRAVNTDLESAIRTEYNNHPEFSDCDCIAFRRNDHGPDPFCAVCDGTGTIPNQIAEDVRRELHSRYEQQLERDYRLAIHAF